MQEKFKDIRIAVIVALAEEYKFFRKYFPSKFVEKFTVGELSIDVLQPDAASQRIGLTSVNRMGNVGAAVAATRLLEVFDLD
jgi:nucleoside phosphorylase